jgi:autotransporter-associated beta strand protein
MRGEISQRRRVFGCEGRWAVLLTLPALLVATAVAQTTWDGGGADDDWGTAQNWIGDVTPANDGTVGIFFSGTTRLAPNVNIPWSIAGLTFNAGSGAFVLSGSTLTTGTGGILNASGTTQTLNTAVVAAAAQTWTATTGNLTVTGPVDTGGSLLTLSAAAARTLTLSGVVSGTGSLQKTGAGTLVLSGSNSHSGGTTLVSGTLGANSNTALGTGLLTLNGGVLTTSGTRNFANSVSVGGNTSLTGQTMNFSGTVSLAANATLTVSNTTTLAAGLTQTGGARALTKAGSGALIILNSLSTTGNVTISGGLLALGSGVALPASLLTLSGGQLGTQGTFSRALGAGAGEVRFTNSGGFFAYGGALTIDGFTGTPEWGVTPNFLGTGRTLVLNSTLATDVVTWTNDFSLGAVDRTISVADNTALTTDRAVISGVISGTGGLIKIGTGRLDLTGVNTFLGDASLRQGEVAVNSLADAGRASALGAGSVIRLGNTTSTAVLRYTGTGHSTNRAILLAGSTGGGTLIADGTGMVTFSGGLSASAAGAKTLTLSGTGTGEFSGPISNGSGTVAVSKTGTGLWILSGSNSQTGNTNVAAGTLQIGSSAAVGTGTLLLSGGTLRAGTAVTLPNTVSLTANSGLSGTSALTFSGSFSQTGSRTLTVSNTALTTFSGPAFVLAENNQARTLTLAGPGDVLVSSVVQDGTGTGADRLTKTSTGELTLTGSNTYSGGFTLSGGLLSLGHDSALGTGTFTVTSGTMRATGGARTVANTVTLGGNGTVTGTSNLTFTGTATQTGSRTVTNISTGTLTLGAVNLSSTTTSRTLTVAGTGETVIGGVVANGGGSTAGALSKSGAGRLILLGANTYSGTTTITAGTVEIRNGAALGGTTAGTSVSSGATLALAGGITTAEGLSLSGTGVGGNGALRNLSGTNTITSRVTLAAASRIQSDSGTLTVDVASGDAITGAFALTAGGAGDIAVNDRINTGAGLTKIGTGSLTLAGSGNVLGAVTVSGGRLVVLGSITGGSVTVASAGTLAGTGTIGGLTTIGGQHTPGNGVGAQSFGAGLTYNAGSTLAWELAGNTATGPGTNFDQVLVTGGNLTVASGSALSLVYNGSGSTVNWSDTFWSANQTWTVVDFSGAGTSSGVFGSVTLTTDSLGQSLATVRPGGGFTIASVGNDVVLTYVVPEPTAGVLVLAAALGAVLRRRCLLRP